MLGRELEKRLELGAFAVPGGGASYSCKIRTQLWFRMMLVLSSWDSAQLIFLPHPPPYIFFFFGLFLLPAPFVPKFWLSNFIIRPKCLEVSQTQERFERNLKFIVNQHICNTMSIFATKPGTLELQCYFQRLRCKRHKNNHVFVLYSVTRTAPAESTSVKHPGRLCPAGHLAAAAEKPRADILLHTRTFLHFP